MKGFTDKIALIWKGLKSEWMKIVFPSKEKVINDSILVVVSSFVIALIIFVFDTLITSGLGFVIK